MGYVLNYFDLNKRVAAVSAKNEALLNQAIANSQSKMQADSSRLLKTAERDNTSSEPPEDLNSYNEDPLLDDMNSHWYDYSDAAARDVKNKNKFSLKNTFLSIKEGMSSSTSTLKDSFLSLHTSKKHSFHWLQQILLYSGNVIGAMLGSSVIEHQAGTDFQFEISLSYVFLSSAIAFLISPIVFEKLCLTKTESFLADFFLFIQNGVFWFIFVTALFFIFG